MTNSMTSRTDLDLRNLLVECANTMQAKCSSEVRELARALSLEAEVELRSRFEELLDGKRSITLDRANSLVGYRVEMVSSGVFGVIERVRWKRVGVLLGDGSTIRTAPENLRIAERRLESV